MSNETQALIARLEARLASWRMERDHGGQFAQAAPRIIAELEADIAALRAGEEKP